MLKAQDFNPQSAMTASVFATECVLLAASFVRADWKLPKDAPGLFRAAYTKADREFGIARRRRQPLQLNWYERKLLYLRLSALKRGMVVDSAVDAPFLQKVVTRHCPVSLVAFDQGGPPEVRPSIDRMLNEGTYARGNLCALSPRVNQAKTALSFHAVLRLAVRGEHSRGLTGVEWMRLCSLMSGAWLVTGGENPGLMPLATYPTPAVFTSTSHLVQLVLLRAALAGGVSMPWADVGSHEDKARLRHLMRELTDAASGEEFAPSAWLRSAVFEAFLAWYPPVQAEVHDQLERFRPLYQSDVDVNGTFESWRYGARHLLTGEAAMEKKEADLMSPPLAD